MVQGHVFDALVSPVSRADPLYLLQATLHGSTAPGFLFASGFVAGLPRAPLSLHGQPPPRAAPALRARRRLRDPPAVLLALEDALEATPAEKAALFACDALQVIAVTQLAVLALQWIVGPALGAGGGRPGRDRPGGRPRRLGVRRGAPSARCRSARTST